MGYRTSVAIAARNYTLSFDGNINDIIKASEQLTHCLRVCEHKVDDRGNSWWLWAFEWVNWSDDLKRLIEKVTALCEMQGDDGMGTVAQLISIGDDMGDCVSIGNSDNPFGLCIERRILRNNLTPTECPIFTKENSHD
jgi:hypothetical protein